MKKILFTLLAASLFFTGCKKDLCNGVTCYNGGTCDENTGFCQCLAGYGGLDCSSVSQPCLAYHTGILIFVNTQDDPYTVERDGAYFTTISGNYSATYNAYTSQCNDWKFTQASGYIFYPTVYNSTACVTDCSTKTISF